MISYEELYNLVKNRLSIKRFTHTEGVIIRAIEYAKIYNIDIEQVKLTALAHDYAKEFTSNETEEYIKKYNLELDEVEQLNHNLLHAKIGACIADSEFGFTKEMCNAIKYHTTGKPEMTMLEKVIYLADATEPNRKYDSKVYVDTIKEDIDQGMVDVSKWVIADIVNKDVMLHSNTVDCFNYYLKKVKYEKK